jgi:signal transduction histidine kinase
MNLGVSYLLLNSLDSALVFEERALNLSNKSDHKKYRGNILLHLGNIHYKKGNRIMAKQYFLEALQISKEQNNLENVGRVVLVLAKLFRDEGKKDSSLYYANKGVETYESLASLRGKVTAYTTLSSVYKLRNNIDSAFKYQALASVAQDSLNEIENLKQFQNLDFEQQLRLRGLEQEKIQFRNKVRTYALLAGISVFMLLAIIFFRNNRQKQKAKERIEQAYNELKSTQAQLIQSEKMASLGELTAGIAHEIQNPLNFVNNFSEVNKELLGELKVAIEKGNINEVRSIANDVIENEDKINVHGKRADAIVKGMLQHSQMTSGHKEPIDINALADEYLRLAYHGFRVKDKSFNAELKTNFDQSIGKISVIPQEIGRVLLNLYNNAFYAVNEKAKQDIPGYEPMVTVRTKKLNGKIYLSVLDNGNGIPGSIKEKIFQPFFTTKPTGQGTGLGLSLAYDIITKGHGGELKVETKEARPDDPVVQGEGSAFIIILPIS